MLKNTNSFAKILMTGALRGPSKRITPPLSYLYNSITYRHINANRTWAGDFACVKNNRRDARIRDAQNKNARIFGTGKGNAQNRNTQDGARTLYSIKKQTQGVLTRFIPVSFVLLKTFFKKQCRRGTYFLWKMCAARIFVPKVFGFRDESNGQDQLLILPTGFRL